MKWYGSWVPIALVCPQKKVVVGMMAELPVDTLVYVIPHVTWCTYLFNSSSSKFNISQSWLRRNCSLFCRILLIGNLWRKCSDWFFLIYICRYISSVLSVHSSRISSSPQISNSWIRDSLPQILVQYLRVSFLMNLAYSLRFASSDGIVWTFELPEFRQLFVTHTHTHTHTHIYIYIYIYIYR